MNKAAINLYFIVYQQLLVKTSNKMNPITTIFNSITIVLPNTMVYYPTKEYQNHHFKYNFKKILLIANLVSLINYRLYL